MKYLDSSWFVDEVGSIEIARPILGYYLAWALLNRLGGEIHTKNDNSELVDLRDRQIKPLDYSSCDKDKLTDEDLNDEGNAFSERYLEKLYFEDYVYTLLANSTDEDNFFVENSWANYDKLAKVIDKRLKRWRKGKDLDNPSWKFW